MIQSVKDILLVTDMDGTLLTDDKKLLNCNLEALRLFKQMGGRYAIATGRVFLSVANYTELLEMLEPSIISNGGMIYDFAAGKALKVATLPRATAWQVLREYHQRFPFLGSIVSANDMRIYQTIGNNYTQMLFDDEHIPYFLSPPEELPADWNKILFAGPKARMPEVWAYAAERSYPGAAFVASEDHYYELLAEGVSKGSALRELCHILGHPLEDTVVIGDYFNDLEMMGEAGHSIAMANAPEEVRAAADEVTLSCNDGGVGHAIYKLIRDYGD